MNVLSQKYKFHCVTKPTDLRVLCAELRERKEFAIDTETTGTDPWTNRMVGISVCFQEGLAFYIPFGHSTDCEQLTKRQVVQEFKPLLEDASIAKYFHHAKFDAMVLYNSGINVKGIKFDTLIAADLLLHSAEKIGLKKLSKKFFDEEMADFQEVTRGQGYKNFSQVPLEIAGAYAAADAHQTFKLKKLFQETLDAQPENKQIFEQIEMPYLELIIELEKTGLIFDRAQHENINCQIAADAEEIHAQITQELNSLGLIVNINSYKQVEKLLFENLKLEPLSRTPTGAYSTNSAVLNQLAQKHRIPGLIAHWRELQGLKNFMTFVLGQINRKTGLLHASYNVIKRHEKHYKELPSLQNLPKCKYDLFSIFKARENFEFSKIDLSNFEGEFDIERKKFILDMAKKIKEQHAENKILLVGKCDLLMQICVLFAD